MLLGSIQIHGERLSKAELHDINGSLSNNSIRLLSLRDCRIKDSDFHNLMLAVGDCKSVIQLNLSLGVVVGQTRIKMVADALLKNRSLTTLFLHGSPLGDLGCRTLTWALACHPNIVSLDLGDCHLTDGAIVGIADLLPPNGAKRGLQELTLSGNPSISAAGWAKFFIGMATSTTLRKLFLDYNKIGDFGIGCLAVALASNTTLQVLDLEATGISKNGAEILVHLVKKYPVNLRNIILSGNSIHPSYIETIDAHLEAGHDDAEVTETPDKNNIAPSETSVECETDSVVSEPFPAPGTVITGPGGGGMILGREDIPKPKVKVQVTSSVKPKSVVLPSNDHLPMLVESCSEGESEESETGSFVWMDREEEEDTEESLSEYSDSEYSDDDEVIVGRSAPTATKSKDKSKSQMLSTGETIHKAYKKQLRKL